MEAKAKAEAERILSEASLEAEEARARTQSLVTEQTYAAQAAADDLRERTSQQIAAGLEAARTEADELMATAREQCRAMVEEAQQLRSRVLADLAKRRKVLHAQIEQLRAGRGRPTDTVDYAGDRSRPSPRISSPPRTTPGRPLRTPAAPPRSHRTRDT